MSGVESTRLLNTMDTSLRGSVGPVGVLILRKKWRDMIAQSAERIEGDQARALLYEINAALSIIMGDAGAAAATVALREKLVEIGLEL